MRPACWMALVGMMACSGLASADDDFVVPAGKRVRVATRNERGIRVGNLVALDDSTLTVKEERYAPETIRRAEISKLDVSTRRSTRKHDALVGLGVGAGIGALFGAVAIHSNSSEDLIQINPAEGALVGVILFAPVGLLIGLASSHGEQWQAVEPARLRLGLRSVPGNGVQLCLVRTL